MDAAVDPCTSSEQCGDGLYCNGEEQCIEGTCRAGSPPCDAIACDEDARRCDPDLDASTPDGGPVVPPLDGGNRLDAGGSHGGVDAGPPDSGPFDAGPPDAGSPPDCSTVSLVPGDGVTTGSRISAANFYVSGSSGPIRACWVEFQPNFPLWTDGLVKRRWIHLPPGTRIQTSGTVAIRSSLTASLDMDRWHFPVGTRFMKEFALPSGRLVETRLWERLPDVGGTPRYRMGSFRWSDIGGTGPQVARYTESGSAATAGGPDPIRLSIDGESFIHQIPNNAECHRCHDGEPGRALGFTAFQLAKDTPDDVDLITLIDDGWLTSSAGYDPSWRFMIDDVTYDARMPAPPTRAALGALHANCGHCHNEWDEADASSITTAGLRVPSVFGLRLRYAQSDVTTSQTYRSSVDRPASVPQLRHTLRIESGAPDRSILWLRDGLRAGMPMAGMRMPPIGTARVNQVMQDDVAAWIRALP
jgi:hypothetical protein